MDMRHFLMEGAGSPSIWYISGLVLTLTSPGPLFLILYHHKQSVTLARSFFYLGTKPQAGWVLVASCHNM